MTPNYLRDLVVANRILANEVEKRTARLFGPVGLDRACEYWCVRAGADKI